MSEDSPLQKPWISSQSNKSIYNVTQNLNLFYTQQPVSQPVLQPPEYVKSTNLSALTYKSSETQCHADWLHITETNFMYYNYTYEQQVTLCDVCSINIKFMDSKEILKTS